MNLSKFLPAAALLAFLPALSLTATAVRADTLEETLAEAYAANPTIEAARAAQRATDENVAQAISGWRPNVTFSASYGNTKVESNLPVSTTTNLKPNLWSLQATQTVFAGGRVLFGLKRAEAGVMAGREQLRNTEQTVLLQAATAYMDVTRDTLTVALNRNNVAVLTRQLEATRDRFRVGEITRTDVSQSEAALAQAKAGLAAAEGALTASRGAFTRVVGRAPGTLDKPVLPALPASEEEVRAAALSANPSLLAARNSEVASKNAVRVAIGGLLPTVQVVGAITRSENSQTRNLVTESRSVTAQLSVPIYAQGLTYSQIRQAKQLNSQDRFNIAVAERSVLEGVNNAWDGLATARATIAAAQEQVRASEIALDGVKQEAAVGSRTTLDVLNAEQALLNARVTLVQAQRNETVAAFNVLSVMGRLNPEGLGLKVTGYDPAVNYSDVKWNFIDPSAGDGKAKK